MGSLLEALVDVPKFIARNTRLSSQITGMRREDREAYSAIALREVLVNAVAHADYACTGMCFFVSIFSDRLEIQSPGMFPFGMTMDDFKSGVSRVRNRVVCRVLLEMGLMEEWGSGYQRIASACQAGGYPEPEWQELSSCVRVIFRPHPDVLGHETINETMNGTKTGNDPINDPINERQRWFLGRLSEGMVINMDSIVARWGVSRVTAKRDVKLLRDLGMIEFIGALKTG